MGVATIAVPGTVPAATARGGVEAIGAIAAACTCTAAGQHIRGPVVVVIAIIGFGAAETNGISQKISVAACVTMDAIVAAVCATKDAIRAAVGATMDAVGAGGEPSKGILSQIKTVTSSAISASWRSQARARSA